MNNDVLRSLRYTLKLNNQDMVAILALADSAIPVEQMASYLLKEDEEGFVVCPDILMSNFLNGLIYHKRDRKSVV